MKIEISRPYKSIATVTTEELPDFTILIGRNGAGKSQLLEALNEGLAVIPDVADDEIELYDMVSFNSPNGGSADRNSNLFARRTANAYLSSETSDPPLVQKAKNIFNGYVNHIGQQLGPAARDACERELRDEIRRLPDFTMFPRDRGGSLYAEALYTHVMLPLEPDETARQGRRSANRSTNSFGGNQAVLLSAAMKLTGKLPHELTYDDILHASHYEGNTLQNSISAVFATYKVDQFIWVHRRLETESLSFHELIAEYRSKYPPPWDTLREILSDMRNAAGEDGLFNFDFSDPDQYDLNMGNYEHFSFTAEMINCTTGARYELGSLSSGERILMALCLASFNHYLGRRLPKLLLLDELDAVLHPSMASALVKTLKTLFVAQGTKVLMTSHSAMTVAAIDDADIFRMSRVGGDVEIRRTTKAGAISELSEGLATVDMGLKIAAYDQMKVTILTEGHNTKHLKKWVELNFTKDVHVFEELEQHTSDSQLLAYGRLLGRMNTNTHFVVVWDCDAADKADALRRELPDTAKVTPFVFARRPENTITQRGIENNYDEAILKPFSFEKWEYGGKWLGREFQSSRKSEFANHVLENGDASYFTHFQDLHSTITNILDWSRNPVEQ